MEHAVLALLALFPGVLPGALALGHNHPVVLEAIRRVLDSGAPLNALEESHIRIIDATEVLSRRGSSLELCRLRKLFEPDPENPVHIVTLRGRGYLFRSAP